MPARPTWTNNAAEGRWEALIGPYLAVARFEPRHGRYMAYVDSRDGRAPDHYAPATFSDVEAAKAWCEDEIERLGAERAPARSTTHTIADLLREPDAEL